MEFVRVSSMVRPTPVCDHNYEDRGGGHRDDVINLRSSGRIPIHRLESHRRRHRSRSGRAHLSFGGGSHDEKGSLEFGKSISTIVTDC